MSTPSKNYELINRALSDPNLSLPAMGLFFYLSNQSVGWKGQIYDIKKHIKAGKKAIMSAAAELKKHGYIRTQSEMKDGLFVGKYYLVNWDGKKLPL